MKKLMGLNLWRELWGGVAMKPKIKYTIIGCNLMWGDNISEETAKYYNSCEQTQGYGDCLTDIMVAERCYIYKKTRGWLNIDFQATNEQLTLNQLNTIISKLESTIPNFPKLEDHTVSYDYESDINVISFTWERGYHTSEDYGVYVLDFNKNGDIIGIELLNFNIESELSSNLFWLL